MEMNQNQIMELLDTLYAKSINGIPKVSQPIDVLANDYLSKNNSNFFSVVWFKYIRDVN